MTAVVVLRCDAVHPDRTPTRCRAYLATDTAIADLAYADAERVGWTQDDGNLDRCPSCSRGES